MVIIIVVVVVTFRRTKITRVVHTNTVSRGTPRGPLWDRVEFVNGARRATAVDQFVCTLFCPARR